MCFLEIQTSVVGKPSPRIRFPWSSQTMIESGIRPMEWSFFHLNRAFKRLRWLRFGGLIPIRFFMIWGSDPQLFLDLVCILRQAISLMGVWTLRSHVIMTWENRQAISSLKVNSVMQRWFLPRIKGLALWTKRAKRTCVSENLYLGRRRIFCR